MSHERRRTEPVQRVPLGRCCLWSTPNNVLQAYGVRDAYGVVTRDIRDNNPGPIVTLLHVSILPSTTHREKAISRRRVQARRSPVTSAPSSSVKYSVSVHAPQKSQFHVRSQSDERPSSTYSYTTAQDRFQGLSPK